MAGRSRWDTVSDIAEHASTARAGVVPKTVTLVRTAVTMPQAKSGLALRRVGFMNSHLSR